MKTVATLVAAASLATAANAQISMQEIGRMNLDATADSLNPWYVGSNPSAVAWNGSQAFIAGFNNGGATGTGLIRVTPTLGSTTGTFDLGGNFGFIAGTPAARGFSGVATNGSSVVAAYDDGTTSANGLTGWDNSGSALWAASFRGSSGVSADPYAGAPGYGALTFSSGFRRNVNAGTGAVANDYSMFVSGVTTLWRDIAHAPNGDTYARGGTDVVKAVRTGVGSAAAATLLVDNVNQDFTNGQNLDYVSGTPFGDFLIYNNRQSGSPGQAAAGILSAADPSSGAALTLTFNLIGGGTFADGNGYYDFSYDAGTQTLAVLDFANRNLHIFQVPAPGALGVLGLGGLVAARRRRG